MAIMGNVNVLIIEENLSFSVQSRGGTVKKIGFPDMTIVDMRKRVRNKREMLITLLKQQQTKKEAEVVIVVEHCLCLIRERLNSFFDHNKKKINLYAVQIMSTNEKINNKGLFQQVFDGEGLRHLQMGLKKEIQQEIQLLFDVKSLLLAGSNINVEDLLDHQNVNRLLYEYRRTIFVAKHMTAAANTVWDQCLDTLDVSNIIGKVLKKFPLGSIFIKAVNCQPEDQFINCQRELERYLMGVMMTIEHRIYQEMSSTVVKVFYELYDQTVTSYFNKRLDLLEVKRNNIMRRKKCLYTC
jgi:hypothetical protein